MHRKLSVVVVAALAALLVAAPAASAAPTKARASFGWLGKATIRYRLFPF
jgi:hypothetical protein